MSKKTNKNKVKYTVTCKLNGFKVEVQGLVISELNFYQLQSLTYILDNQACINSGRL